MKTPFTFSTQAVDLQKAIAASTRNEFADFAEKLLTEAGIMGLSRAERMQKEAEVGAIRAEIHRVAFDEMLRMRSNWQGGTAAASNFVEAVIHEVCVEIAKNPDTLILEVIWRDK